MNAHFPRIISLLRREQKISQKQAAAELGISQALLSHYEKGIRECGLDFVVRAADYYGVSCDYLLGRSPERSGMTISADELPDPGSAGRETAAGSIGLLVVLNKKLIANSINILFDLLPKAKNRALISEVSTFLMLGVYRMFRIVYSCDPKNQEAMFAVSKPLAFGYAGAAMQRCEANAAAISAGEIKHLPGIGEAGEVTPVPLTSASISAAYPLFAASLFNLIKNAEEYLACDQSEQ